MTDQQTQNMKYQKKSKRCKIVKDRGPPSTAREKVDDQLDHGKDRSDTLFHTCEHNGQSVQCHIAADYEKEDEAGPGVSAAATADGLFDFSTKINRARESLK